MVACPPAGEFRLRVRHDPCVTAGDSEQRPAALEQRVTPLELFFDLMFVFAITQVTGFIAAHPTWTRLVQALAILAVLWWAWVAYAWLGNTAASDDGAMRVVLLIAMGPLLVLSLAVPGAFGGDGLIFGVAYLCVRVLHLAGYLILARDDPALRALVSRLASTMLPAVSLIVLAGFLDGVPRALCWIAALAVDYGGLALRGTDGWNVQPAHFAERHGLIIIIALGESIVSLGVGASGLGLGASVIVSALLGVVVAAALWWAYFDVVALAGERRMERADAAAQSRIARDSYTYLHFPMVTGIVLFALGVKESLIAESHQLSSVAAVSLCGGGALYLLALSAFKRRNYGSFNYPRLAGASLLVALIPVAGATRAVVALGLVAAVTAALIAYETLRYAAARERIRHA
jgi:low temperature requirement protein LtrA